jgi:hypothetical protein
MLHKPFLILAASLGLLSAPLHNTAEELEFSLAPKSSLTKTFSSKFKAKSDSMRMFMGDQEMPAEMMPKMELSIDSEDDFVISDEYLEIADGRPTKLKRTFEKLSSSSTQDMQMELPEDVEPSEEMGPKTSNKSSELEGKAVLFAWDEKASEYKRTFADGEGEERLLADLAEDMDLRAFLPGKSVKVGDTWEVDAVVASEAINSPGGDLHLEDDDDDGKFEGFDRDMRDSAKGEVKATFKGMRDEGGRQVGVIAIAGKVTSQAEGEEEGDEGTETRKAEVETEFEGEILWDVESGHLHSAQISGPVTATFSQGQEVETPRGKMNMRQEFDMKGELSLSVSVEK